MNYRLLGWHIDRLGYGSSIATNCTAANIDRKSGNRKWDKLPVHFSGSSTWDVSVSSVSSSGTWREQMGIWYKDIKTKARVSLEGQI